MLPFQSMFKDNFAAYSVLLAKSSVALTWAIFVPLKTHGLKVVRLSRCVRFLFLAANSITHKLYYQYLTSFRSGYAGSLHPN